MDQRRGNNAAPSNDFTEHTRWNFAAIVSESASFQTGRAWSDPSAVLPLFIGALTPSTVVIGLIPVLQRLGFLLPQLHVGPASYQTYEGLTGILRLDGLIASAIGALGGGGMVLAFAIFGTVIFQQEALGFGDVKLMAMVGAFFGWKVVLVAFFLAPFVGLLYGIPLLLAKGEHIMPYGPFLSLAAGLTLIFRETLCHYAELLEQLYRLIAG